MSLLFRFLSSMLAVMMLMPPALVLAQRGQFYVAPYGRRDGDGSKERPWDLATALAHPRTVKPGDTIWLRGGVYVPGTAPEYPSPNRGFVSYLMGTASSPIIVRQYPGERATLDAKSQQGAVFPYVAVLAVRGQYTWYWGFEITDSSVPRDGPSGIIGSDQPPGAIGNKFINLIIHDVAGQGIGMKATQHPQEIYGNLIYYNGGTFYEHQVYDTNTTTKTTKYLDNILFSGTSHGFHMYSERYPAPNLNNFDIEGNIVFNSGDLLGEQQRNVLVGGDDFAASNVIVRNNYTYFNPAIHDGNENALGYVAGFKNGTVENNIWISGSTALRLTKVTNTTITGNRFYGKLSGFAPADYPSNTYYTARPTGTWTFVRPNQYEPGRAHIAVYNWDLLDTVDVDVSTILGVGARYEVRNAQDYFGTPILTGTYDGKPLRLSMRGLRVAAPIGTFPHGPERIEREFAAFVLITP